jgi:hypothetical protein
VGDYQAALLYTQRALELRLARNSRDTCDDLQVQLGKVLYASGSSARQTHATDKRPVDAVIMAIVDAVDVDGALVYDKSGAAS